jgi:aryl-alcohol dehydrogenase-like predicted oxidoreductase
MLKRRPLGRTGLQICELGFGCGPGARLMVGDDSRLQERVVARALERGLDYFDTASDYGDGRSETHLGAALTALKARPMVATKVVLGEADLGDLAGAVERSIEASLRRLRRDAVEVVHLHNRVLAGHERRMSAGGKLLLTVDDLLGPRGVAEGLHRLQQRGLVGRVGCCGFGGDGPAVAQVIASGAFQSILVDYSILTSKPWEPPTQGRGEGFGALAAARGMGVVALRVLEAGRLTGATAVGAMEPYDFLLDDNPDLAMAAIRFVLSNSEVSTALVGVSDLDQLDLAIDAAERGPLEPGIMARLKTIAAAQPAV